MSFDFRFEPPTLQELEDMAKSSCIFNHNCNGCEYDCEDDYKNRDDTHV